MPRAGPALKEPDHVPRDVDQPAAILDMRGGIVRHGVTNPGPEIQRQFMVMIGKAVAIDRHGLGPVSGWTK